jgi:hypothetical protein
MPNLGIEALTDEDRSYRGSTFREVVDAVFANPYQRVWGSEGEPPLPVYKVTLGSLLRGILPFGQPPVFARATARAVDAHSDLRWGPDRLGYRRLLHPNGVCLTGEWRITAETAYSGYFAAGSVALAIGRYSTCCAETRRGHTRSLSLVGKLFPTTDRNHTNLLRTASFITQEDIGGAYSAFINDAELRTAPDTTVSRRGGGIPILLLTGFVFGRVDKQPSIRQLYSIAELGLPAGAPTRAPEFMRLMVKPDQPRIPGADLDFRDEIMAQIYDRGDPVAKRTLTFNIEATDEGSTTGPAFRERRTFRNWRPIGTLTFDRATVSYNGDSVIHFNHPTWREDRNNPATATRINARKVR